MIVLNKTCIGYNHIFANTVCQDNSFSYQDDNKSIIATCDGHGGEIYIRSNIGSKLACKAAFNIFNKLFDEKKLNQINDDILEKIKLEVLCEWNHLIENDYSHRPFMEYELEGLDEKQIAKLEKNYVTAYGTTMHAAIITNGMVICLSIGDGGVFLMKKNRLISAFPEAEDENVANITCSLCGDNAYEHIHAKCFNKKDIDCILCVTDGVTNPYQNYDNFRESFVIPVIKEINDNGDKGIEKVKKFICELGISKGIGDDVSVALIYDKDKSDSNNKEGRFKENEELESPSRFEDKFLELKEDGLVEVVDNNIFTKESNKPDIISEIEEIVKSKDETIQSDIPIKEESDDKSDITNGSDKDETW